MTERERKGGGRDIDWGGRKGTVEGGTNRGLGRKDRTGGKKGWIGN